MRQVRSRTSGRGCGCLSVLERRNLRRWSWRSRTVARNWPITKSSLPFGLSGTGKTTLSADSKRDVIGDDEHFWSDDGVFNIEGGCYAKAVHLSPESEPEIFQASRFGAVLESVVLDDAHVVNFDDTSITENTRGA